MKEETDDDILYPVLLEPMDQDTAHDILYPTSPPIDSTEDNEEDILLPPM